MALAVLATVTRVTRLLEFFERSNHLLFKSSASFGVQLSLDGFFQLPRESGFSADQLNSDVAGNHNDHGIFGRNGLSLAVDAT